MSAIRSVAVPATDLTYSLAGRRTVVGFVRYVLVRARLDYPNDLTTNGELTRWNADLETFAED